MSVSTPIVQSWDGTARRIYLNQGVGDYFPIEDLYHEYRNQRRLDENLRKFAPLLRAEGNIPKGAGAFTPRYVVLLDGTKVVPFDEVLQLNQLGDMITDDPDNDPDLYDISGLTVPKPIFIKPSEAETIQLNSASIEHSSYNDGVTIDEQNITTRAKVGVEHPAGTSLQPSLNQTDLHSISGTKGFNRVFVIGNIILESTNSWARHEFKGESATKTNINIPTTAEVGLCEFYDCSLDGYLDGIAHVERCVLNDVKDVSGYIFKSALTSIRLHSSIQASIYDCFSTIAGPVAPDIDMNVTGVIKVEGYKGGLYLWNYASNGAHTIGMNGAKVTLEDTITSGTFVFRGTGTVVDENGVEIRDGLWNGGVTIINETVSYRAQEMVRKILGNAQEIDTTANTLTIMDDDKVTPFLVYDLKDDSNNPSSTNIYKRIPQ